LQADTETIAIDRPGWDGRSESAGLAGNADAALAELDRRGIERATIAGHSLGAAIAVWIAIHWPARVHSLVLAAPAANLASLDPIDRWLALPAVGELSSAGAMTGLGLALSSSAVRRRFLGALPDAYLVRSAKALRSPRARRAFITEQRALVRELPDLDARLVEITAPTWIVAGNRDRIVRGHAPRRLAEQIAGARLIELPGAGHLLPQLHARRLAEVIAQAVSPAQPALIPYADLT
jgi:pimeloyl-ACP methyl ester carboxylesterase